MRLIAALLLSALLAPTAAALVPLESRSCCCSKAARTCPLRQKADCHISSCGLTANALLSADPAIIGDLVLTMDSIVAAHPAAATLTVFNIAQFPPDPPPPR